MFTADILFAFLVGGILLVLLFPLPTLLLDVLLVLNIAVGLFILVVMFYLRTPMDFSSFPALLLIITLFRLSLNVASTKLILLNGQAGQVIDAFGQFVVGNNFVVGAVVFMILVMIQFLVITKGAGRIAEVAARFTLDAMPGKQMSIDADLNAGIIDEHEARERRQALSAEADFFGSMDGASKFVKGDAVAGLVITAINILGGLAIGVFQQGMAPGEALQVYTILTIGDGLVSQIPALVISVAAGMLTTKAAQTGGLGGHISQQLLRRPEPLFVCGIMLLFLAVLPGLPFLPFSILGGAALAGAWRVLNRNKEVGQNEGIENARGLSGPGASKDAAARSLPQGSADDAAEDPVGLPVVQPMCLEIGFGLVPLVDPGLDGDLVARLGVIREQIRQELGFLIPPISVQDNLELANNQYRVLVRGLERTRGEVQMGLCLAINPGDVTGSIEGTKTFDPAFGFEAVWIHPRRTEAAEAKGFTVVECSSVITTHVAKVIKENAAELLNRQAVSNLLDELKKTDGAVVEELIPQRMTIGVVHRVLQFLLAEQVPIHDLAAVLETLSDYAGQSKDPLVLCEFCRQALKGHLVARHAAPGAQLHVVILDPQLEAELQELLSGGGSGILSLPPQRAEQMAEAVRKVFEEAQRRTEQSVILLAAPALRANLVRLTERKIPDLVVLSYAEVSDDVSLQVMGTVSMPSEECVEAGR